MAAPRVDEVDLGVLWLATGSWSLVADDAGNTQLTLLADLDDPDQRSVRLEWSGSVSVRRDGPSTEAREGHPLHGSGLERLMRIGEVVDSPLVDQLGERSHDALRHWIVPLDECLVEVLAATVAVERVEP
jgi:hypothetical protein